MGTPLDARQSWWAAIGGVPPPLYRQLVEHTTQEQDTAEGDHLEIHQVRWEARRQDVAPSFARLQVQPYPVCSPPGRLKSTRLRAFY